MKRLGRILLTLTASTALVVSTAGVAVTAPRVACGATITTSVVLERDLTCSGVGLYVSPGITIDLNGHRVTGPASQSASMLVVDTDEGQAPVAVTNGTVRRWGTLLEDLQSQPNVVLQRVRAVDVRSTADGVAGSAVFDRVEYLRSNGASFVGLFGDVEITSSTFRGGDFAVSAGHVVVRRSSFIDMATAVSCSETPITVTGSRFVRNRIGVATSWCYGSRIEGNMFRQNDTGLSTEMVGFSVVRLDDIRRNTFVQNGTAAALSFGADLTGNTFRQNDVGVYSERAETGYADLVRFTFTRNSFTRNGDAVWVDSPASFARNIVVKNSGVGVWAPQGVDRGGNVIRRNGQPSCIGCSTRS